MADTNCKSAIFGFVVAMKTHRVLQQYSKYSGFILMLTISSFLGSRAIAHPNHDAVAEADWNAKTKSLEVALQVNAHELERTVSQAVGMALDLDTEEAAEHLKKYIASRVRCLRSDGKAVGMKWVGAEIKVRSAWLYFEFPLGNKDGDKITDCSLTNTLFFEQYEDQKNTIALRLEADQARSFLRFSKEQPVIKVKPDESDATPTPSTEPK